MSPIHLVKQKDIYVAIYETIFNKPLPVVESHIVGVPLSAHRKSSTFKGNFSGVRLIYLSS